MKTSKKSYLRNLSRHLNSLCKRRSFNQRGMGLIVTILVISIISIFVAAFHNVMVSDTATTRYQKDSQAAFYSGESGMNIRASAIRELFNSFALPTGTGPSTTNPCTGSNMGTGNFACQNFTFGKHTVRTYVIPSPSNPQIIVIPQGDTYQGLTAQEYLYTVYATSTNNATNSIDSQLEMKFRSRTVPLYQFGAFYNKSMEIFPRFAYTMIGPIHVNGNLYMVTGSSADVSIDGQITVTGNAYRGARYRNDCGSRALRVKDPTNYRSIFSCTNNTEITSSYVVPWNNMIKLSVPTVAVPPISSFAVGSGNAYYNRSDLRLDLKLNGAGNPDTASHPTTGVIVNYQSGLKDNASSTTLNGCAGSISGKAVGSSTFFNARENKTIRVLDVDMQALFNCIKNNSAIMGGKLLSDTTDGGLVFHMTVTGNNSSGINNYGVRIRNGAQLKSTVSGAPTIKGMTLITDQPLYVMGNFNSTTKKPVALLTDALNLLSNNFSDSSCSSKTGGGACTSSNRRVSANMTVNAALVSGTVEGQGNDGSGAIDSSGLMTFPNLLEDWTSRTLTISGSMVSIGTSTHVNQQLMVGMPYYVPPTRAWSYDISFNNPANLPPMSLQLVYLKEELFIRDFTQ